MKSRSGFRKLTLDSGVWQYRVGESTVVIFSPTGIKSLANFQEITGLTWNSIERLYWKNRGCDHAANIRSSTVKAWIEKTLIGEKSGHKQNVIR